MRVSEGNGKGLDFELNLAPIIDCFTVIIAFLLVSASFASIGIFEAGVVVGDSSAAKSSTPPELEVTLIIKSNYTANLKVTGKRNQQHQIAANAGLYDFDKLRSILKQLHSDFPKWDTLVLESEVQDQKVTYDQIAQTMGQVKKEIPNIILSVL